jgi:hypothetical protein
VATDRAAKVGGPAVLARAAIDHHAVRVVAAHLKGGARSGDPMADAIGFAAHLSI